MAKENDKNIVEQVRLLLQQFGGPFPYDDARKVLKEISEALPEQVNQYQDLIPDLDSYFYVVDAYAGGVSEVLARPSIELVRARGALKNSFFQAHPKYKPLEWTINQINTPKLYQKIALSNQLRQILVELFTRRLLNEQRSNATRQKQLLSTIV